MGLGQMSLELIIFNAIDSSSAGFHYWRDNTIGGDIEGKRNNSLASISLSDAKRKSLKVKTSISEDDNSNTMFT